MQDALFRKVPPMRGAVELVQGLVRVGAEWKLTTACGGHPDCAGDGVDEAEL